MRKRAEGSIKFGDLAVLRRLLSRDPTMRWIVGGKAMERNASSSSQMSRFETAWLTGDANLAALADLPGAFPWTTGTSSSQ